MTWCLSCWAAIINCEGATVFAYPVSDPERYGVAEFDASGRVLSQLRKNLSKPKSRYAVTGLVLLRRLCCGAGSER